MRHLLGAAALTFAWVLWPMANAVAGDPPYKNTVHWVTASEHETFGYDVFRGESKEGPFVKLTDKPILGAGTSDERHDYRFVDETIDPTKGYYYYVEEVSLAGVRQRISPIQLVPPKAPAAGKDAPAAAAAEANSPAGAAPSPETAPE